MLVLLVTTGSRKKVLKDTQAIRYLENLDNPETIIVTDESNLDIFNSIQKFKVKLYPMNAETFLILKNKKFDLIMDSSHTELSQAFLGEFYNIIHNSNCHYIRSSNHCVYPNTDYYFEQLSYPVDFIHSKIKAKGKFLIGINIGESEHVTKKPPVKLLVDLMNKLSLRCECRFVLFGNNYNDVREKMILRSFKFDSNNIISMVGLEEAPLLAQAISLCKVFISFDSFRMHLSTAIGQKTIGLFARTSSHLTGDFKNLVKITADKQIPCQSCNELTECELIETNNPNNYCFNSIDLNETIASVIEIITGRDDEL